MFPRWEQNPYLTILYLAAEADGWYIDGGVSFATLASDVAGLRRGDVFHVQWTSPVTAGAADLGDALARADRFERLLEDLRRRGVHVLWTVHNSVAHDTPFEDAELRVNAALARWCTRVIQLHDQTRSSLLPTTDLPADRIVTLTHCSYAGIYPEQPSAEDARRLIGCPEGVPTVGLIGQLRPYKGVDVLLEAAGLAARKLEDLVVLLAGRTEPEQVAQIDALLPPSVQVLRHHDFLDPGDITAWYQASNVIALPYRRILNSGSALLAATVGRPVILPDDTPLRAVYADEPWVDFYDAGSPTASLAEAIVCRATGDAVVEQSARDFAAGWTPYDMSRAFLRFLDGLEVEA